MSALLRQSTAQNVVVGPLLSSSDFLTAQTALTIAQADRQLNKAWGASFAQTADTSNATHVARGFYRFQLTSGDTDTLGPLILSINMGSSAPFWKEFLVVSAYEDDVRKGVNRAGGAIYGTAQAGASLSIQLAASASATDNLYQYGIVEIVGGTGAGQWRYITGYTGSSKTAAVDRAWAVNPSSGSLYVIYAAPPISTLAEVADAVWDEQMTGALGAYNARPTARQGMAELVQNDRTVVQSSNNLLTKDTDGTTTIRTRALSPDATTPTSRTVTA